METSVTIPPFQSLFKHLPATQTASVSAYGLLVRIIGMANPNTTFTHALLDSLVEGIAAEKSSLIASADARSEEGLATGAALAACPAITTVAAGSA